MLFLDAPGDTDKTFLINLILAKLRLEGKIALASASSGIAATLLTGGRTLHSTFKIPLDLYAMDIPICSIKKDTALCRVIQEGEATVVNGMRYVVLFRVGSPKCLTLLVREERKTRNVLCSEIFN